MVVKGGGEMTDAQAIAIIAAIEITVGKKRTGPAFQEARFLLHHAQDLELEAEAKIWEAKRDRAKKFLRGAE